MFRDDLTRIEEQSRLEMESRSMIEDTEITKKSISEETMSNSEAVAALSDEQREVYMSALEGYVPYEKKWYCRTCSSLAMLALERAMFFDWLFQH